MDNTYSIQDQLFTYVKENTYKDTSTLNSETMLFKEGIFDSMGFVLLIDYLENTFRVQLEDRDLVESNFETIDAITNLVTTKVTAVA